MGAQKARDSQSNIGGPGIVDPSAEHNAIVFGRGIFSKATLEREENQNPPKNVHFARSPAYCGF
jgi:hypothetical protein